MHPTDAMTVPSVLRLGDVLVDLGALRVRAPWGVEDLSPLDVALLRYLAARRGAVVSQPELLREVWGFSPRAQSRAAYHGVARLRKKIEPDPASPRYLVSVRGAGFRLDVPVAPTSPRAGLVGREDDLARLAATVDDASLTVLVGPGGVGKTRLARALAGDRQALFVSLESAFDEAGVLDAVARALGIELPQHGAAAWVAAVVDDLGPSLLVLDNAEQVAACLAELWAGPLGGVTPRVLVTSRAVLPLAGAHTVRLAPLDPAACGDLLRHQAARLDVPPPSPDEAAHLARLTDGLPLLLELGAARVPLLGWGELIRRLTDDLGVLAAEQSDRPERHRSARAVLELSWSLLSPAASRLLGVLALFVGPVDLGAVDEVAEDFLATAEELVRNGLVASHGGALHLLETVRRHALDRMDRAHWDGAVIAHAAWCARLATPDAVDHASRLGLEGGLDAFRTREPDARAALDRLLALPPTPAVRALIAACATVGAVATERAGPPDRAAAHLETLAHHSDGEQRERALLRAVGRWLDAGNRGEAERVLAQMRGGDAHHAIANARVARMAGLPAAASLPSLRGAEVPGPHRSALLSARSGCHEAMGDRAAALADLDAALALVGGHDLVVEGVLRQNKGVALLALGQTAAAARELEAALELHGRVGNLQSEIVSRRALGLAELARGDEDAAFSELGAARRLAMRLGERMWAARIALAEAVGHHRAGRLPAVRALLEEQWRQAELVPQLETQIVAHLGLVELESGHLDRAIGLLHRALELAELRGERHTVWDVRLNLALADYLRGRWLEARQGFERVLVEAEAESPNHVVLALINLVDVFLALGDVEASVHVLDRLAGDPSVREATHYAAELETLKLAVALARGDAASIAAYARAVDAAPGLFGYRRVELLGRACLAHGQLGRATAALADLEARAAVAGIDSGDAPVLLAAARLRQLIDATTSVNPTT